MDCFHQKCILPAKPLLKERLPGCVDLSVFISFAIRVYYFAAFGYVKGSDRSMIPYSF